MGLEWTEIQAALSSELGSIAAPRRILNRPDAFRVILECECGSIWICQRMNHLGVAREINPREAPSEIRAFFNALGASALLVGSNNGSAVFFLTCQRAGRVFHLQFLLQIS